MTGELARAMRKAGTEATVVFALQRDAVGRRLDRYGVPYLEVGMAHHRDVLYHPRRIARAVAEAGETAIVAECGYLGTAVRAGGFRGPIIGVENGLLHELPRLSPARRAFLTTARAVNARIDAVEVAVSQYMLERLRQVAHAKRTVCIHNGIETNDYPATRARPDSHKRVVLGCAGRMVPSKGFDVLIRSLALTDLRDSGALLRIAGGGPDHARLVALVGQLGLRDRVEFVGPVDDMVAFWAGCDIAVTPAVGPEAFSMVTLEAMACGLPVVATNVGAIPEVVADGSTGALVPPGDPGTMGGAISSYVREPDRRGAHGAAARQRCVDHFDIADVARRYVALAEAVRGSAAMGGSFEGGRSEVEGL